MDLTAVLTETVSNQEYIFSGNRLKENLGGSHLLKTVYKEPLKEALDAAAPGNAGFDAWQTSDSTVAMAGGAEVGYIGGGNALLFFDDAGRAKDFIRNFSRILLSTRPGLRTAFGMLTPFDLQQFSAAMASLHDELQTAKNRSCPRTIPPGHGITAACPYSGEAIELGREEDQTRKRLVSSLSYSRLSAAESAGEALTTDVKEQLQGLSFTDEIGKLGQSESKSYVAVAHADGNGMGQRFRECPSLGELRKLSNAVTQATRKAFGLLVEDAVKVVRIHLKDDKGFSFGNILPVRPIIIGGDDITFVCEGRLGIYFAERFLKHIETASTEAGAPFTACAGIAVVKSKYPFFKAYRYAEELCTEAKKASRGSGTPGPSFLDFLISSGGFSGSIEHIRKRHFSRPDGTELHYGPYRINNRGNDKSTAMLRDGIVRFQDREKWSHSRAMRLRELLTGDPLQCGNFITANDLQLPAIPGRAGTRDTWLRSSTPYYDMLDAMDFYPEVLLKEVEK